MADSPKDPKNPLNDVTLLRAVLDAVPMRAFWKDRDSRYLGCNQAFADDAGRPIDEIVGKTDYDMPWKKEESDSFVSIDREIMASGKPRYHFLESLLRGDGTQSWVDTNKVPLKNERGEVIGILGTYEDITARKAEEEELRKNRDKLEELVKARTLELEAASNQLREEIKQRELSQAERDRLQQQIIEAQKRAIAELSTPIIPVMEGILVMPLVGSIDSLRAKEIMRSVLTGIGQHRAKVVILDITGVPLVDSGVAGHLNKTIQAARLKGARTIVSGISDAVAETIVDLGIDWSGIVTLSDLHTSLLAALDSVGIKLSREKS
ncbi:MAG: RsbR, positive regulator of sigma-B [Labilithrix sp.]|nr:RsbR, positive regulator of sigma-B [Labilithrix sp.]